MGDHKYKYLVKLYVGDNLMSETRSDDQELSYGAAYSSILRAGIRTELFEDGQEVPLEEVVQFMDELTADHSTTTDVLGKKMAGAMRDIGIKTDNDVLRIMAQYLRELADRVESEPFTVHDLLVFAHEHEGKCLGITCTGYVWEPDMPRSIISKMEELLKDDIEARTEEKGSAIVIGGDRWFEAEEKCVELGIIAPAEEG